MHISLTIIHRLQAPVVAFILLFLWAQQATAKRTPARFREEALYACFLNQQQDLWGDYIRTTDWDNIDNAERLRLLNYEYGYIAYAISAKHPQTKDLLDTFNRHITLAKGIIPESRRLTFLAAAASYAVSLNNLTMLTKGPKVFSYSDQAVKADPNDPYALTLRGSIYFYCPKTFGGDKQKALSLLLRAEELFRKQNLTAYSWNYRSLQLVIAQCYEKTGQKEKAIAYCRQILNEEPGYLYIRNTYLPELLGEKQPDPNDPQNIGAGFVSGLEEE